jgi:hypothetical protein
MTGEPTQSEVFTAKVLHKLSIHSLSRDEFESLKRTYANNLYMIDTKAREHIVSNVDQITGQAKVGDLVLLENTKGNLNFLFANNFVHLGRNAGWIIGKKVGPTERAGAP